MDNNYFNLSSKDQQTLLLSSEHKLNMSAQIIEKDDWLCLLLEKILNASALFH